MTGANIPPRQPDNQSAFRSKLSGLYRMVIVVNATCQVFAIKTGKITIPYNGKSALDFCLWLGDKFLQASTPHLYLIVATWHLIKISLVRWKFWHVKGHQDYFASPLDWWPTLNVEMDSLAEVHWLKARESSLAPSEAIKHEPWSIWHGARKYVTPIRNTIYSHIHNPNVNEYWYSRDWYTSKNQHTWDWDAIHNAMHFCATEGVKSLAQYKLLGGNRASDRNLSLLPIVSEIFCAFNLILSRMIPRNSLICSWCKFLS